MTKQEFLSYHNYDMNCFKCLLNSISYLLLSSMVDAQLNLIRCCLLLSSSMLVANYANTVLCIQLDK